SSRRRHTRFDCDWSSDVCSSDLVWLLQSARDPEAEGCGLLAASGSCGVRAGPVHEHAVSVIHPQAALGAGRCRPVHSCERVGEYTDRSRRRTAATTPADNLFHFTSGLWARIFMGNRACRRSEVHLEMLLRSHWLILAVFVLSILTTLTFWAWLPEAYQTNESSDYIGFYEPVAR